MMHTTTCPNFDGADYKYTVITVIVFAGSPSSRALSEAYRLHFDNERDARRVARRITTTARTDWQTGRSYVPPCASVFEDSPTRGLGKHVAEYTSRARAKFLASLAAS